MKRQHGGHYLQVALAEHILYPPTNPDIYRCGVACRLEFHLKILSLTIWGHFVQFRFHLYIDPFILIHTYYINKEYTSIYPYVYILILYTKKETIGWRIKLCDQESIMLNFASCSIPRYIFNVQLFSLRISHFHLLILFFFFLSLAT